MEHRAETNLGDVTVSSSSLCKKEYICTKSKIQQVAVNLKKKNSPGN